jgi:hypothetical protein
MGIHGAAGWVDGEIQPFGSSYRGRYRSMRRSTRCTRSVTPERQVIVARQLGHDARLTLSTYGHVIEELEDLPRIDAETAIGEARTTLAGEGRATETSTSA